mgnify:CR=1 FL=1
MIPAGHERAWLAPLPLTLLDPHPSLLELLGGVGVETCGALAALEREAVEVRFGPEGVDLWRRARGEDRRILFGRAAPDRPHASLDFVDYVVTDPERLLFTANALLGSVCEGMRRRGVHARRLLLRLELANGESWERSLRAARPTASRTRWRALIRSQLERLTVPDAVSGMWLEVQSTEEAGAQQGDLFDRGFATAGAVEAALMRLVDEQGPVVVRPSASAHPLAERRVEWLAADDGAIAQAEAEGAAIVLQLLPEPRRVQVQTEPRRDHVAPTHVLLERPHTAVPVEAGEWLELLAAAGPQRLSGGHWEGGYAREYFRCITANGTPLWIFRDPFSGGWFLHGWWG